MKHWGVRSYFTIKIQQTLMRELMLDKHLPPMFYDRVLCGCIINRIQMQLFLNHSLFL